MSRREDLDANYALQRVYNPETGDWLSDSLDVIIRFLQDLFFQHREFTFHPDESQTRLIVSGAGATNTRTIGTLPGIIVTRAEFAYSNTAMDQLLRIDPTTGKRTHTDLVVGGMSIHCISRSGPEADSLAVQVAQAIRRYRLELQRARFHDIGNRIQVSAQSSAMSLLPGTEQGDLRMTTVSVPVHFQESWSYERNLRAVSSLQFRVRAYGVGPDGVPSDPSALDEYGQPIESHPGVIVERWTSTES